MSDTLLQPQPTPSAPDRAPKELAAMAASCETGAEWTLAKARNWWQRFGSRPVSPGWHVQFDTSRTSDLALLPDDAKVASRAQRS